MLNCSSDIPKAEPSYNHEFVLLVSVSMSVAFIGCGDLCASIAIFTMSYLNFEFFYPKKRLIK